MFHLPSILHYFLIIVLPCNKDCVKCPNTEFFLVRIFQHSDWIRMDTLAFGLNTERYEVSLHIQSECGKIRTWKNSVVGHFSRSEKLPYFDIKNCPIFYYLPDFVIPVVLVSNSKKAVPLITFALPCKSWFLWLRRL